MIFSVYRLSEAKGSHLTKKVAVIGLDSVGLGIAQTLLRAGFETIGCDLNQQILRDFETAGGVSVPSLAISTPIATASPITFTQVTWPRSTKAYLLWRSPNRK